jgi:nitroreductase
MDRKVMEKGEAPAAVLTAETGDGAALMALLHKRQTLLPKRLGPPGPDAAQLAAIVAAAGQSPDHGRLQPWRLVLVPGDARPALADAFAQALIERDAQALPEQIEQARDKAYRSPVLLLAVVDLARGDAAIPAAERIVAAGCALQNMLLMATSLGFGSALTSGKALHSGAVRQLFALADGEEPLCFLSVGSAVAPKAARQRPGPEAYLSTLAVPGSKQGA